MIASSRRRSRATGVWRASSVWICCSMRDEVAVDLVVERDHLVGELAIALLEGAHRAANRAQNALPHLL